MNFSFSQIDSSFSFFLPSFLSFFLFSLSLSLNVSFEMARKLWLNHIREDNISLESRGELVKEIFVKNFICNKIVL